MKKTISYFLLRCCFGICLLSAQNLDVLFLRNNTQISCTITDMTETAVSYTRTDRPKTMVFSTPMEQIVKIVFSDGTVAQIASTQTTTSTATQATASTATQATASTATQQTAATQTAVQQTAVAQVATQQAAVVQRPVVTQQQTAVQQRATTTQKSTVAGKGRIYRDKNNYMYDDKYISEKEVERVLRTNYAANEEWQSAKKMLTAGWVFVGLGGACALGALGCIPAGGAAVGGACGGALVFSSVGLGLALGCSKRMDKAINIYNAQIDMATELHLFAAPEGLGVAIRF